MSGFEASDDFWTVYYDDVWETQPHRDGYDLWKLFCMGGEL